MKKFTTPYLVALATVAFLASSCEKESNSIDPTVSAIAKTDDASVIKKNGYGGIAPCAIGEYWLQGTLATGILDDAGLPTSIPMRLVSIQGTGVGEIDTYVTDKPMNWNNIFIGTGATRYLWSGDPISYVSSYGKTYNIEYTDNAFLPLGSDTPVSVYQRCITSIDENGNITMRVTLNLNK